MPNPGQLIVGISGQPGAGKSTLARELASQAGGTVIAFGDYVRAIAAQLGLNGERPTLQSLGERLVGEDPVAFTTDFLDWAGGERAATLVVDGVRHRSVEDALRTWADARNASYKAVLVTAPAHIRAADRAGGNIDAMRRIDSHPAERQAARDLHDRADVVLARPWTPAQVLAILAP